MVVAVCCSDSHLPTVAITHPGNLSMILVEDGACAAPRRWRRLVHNVRSNVSTHEPGAYEDGLFGGFFNESGA